MPTSGAPPCAHGSERFIYDPSPSHPPGTRQTFHGVRPRGDEGYLDTFEYLTSLCAWLDSRPLWRLNGMPAGGQLGGPGLWAGGRDQDRRARSLLIDLPGQHQGEPTAASWSGLHQDLTPMLARAFPRQ